jgi:hypothetical protein
MKHRLNASHISQNFLILHEHSFPPTIPLIQKYSNFPQNAHAVSYPKQSQFTTSEMQGDPAYWAILIGNNFYKDEPLCSCVNDINLVKEYLRGGKTPANIDILIASSPDTMPSPSCRPVEHPDQWPTLQNVISNITRVTDQAKPGDLVYIHYSGHGVSTTGVSGQFNSNQHTGDVALVLFDEDANCCLLEGKELAELLKKMTDKGLILTLVLDCCFSGGFVRETSQKELGIRSLTKESSLDSLGAIYGGRHSIILREESIRGLRDAQVRPQWLVNPENYTIYTACGPHENAKALSLGNEQRYGALTVFLIFALNQLRRAGTQITHESLYRQICINFHVSWPRQTPMRYGNSKVSFFGELNSGLDVKYFPVFLSLEDDGLQLGAGKVHGTCEGDEFVVYPFNSSEDLSRSIEAKFYKAKVSSTRALTSDLVPLQPISNIGSLKIPWKAKLLKSLSLWKVPVRIDCNPHDNEHWLELAKHRRYLSISTDSIEEDPLFHVIINEKQEYQILSDAKREIFSLPKIHTEMDDAFSRVLDILEHIATFKYFESIENRLSSPLFEQSFTIHLSDKTGKGFETKGALSLGEDEELCLTIENHCRDTLYLYIFDLGPSWQIDNLLSQLGGGGFKVVPPKGEVCTGREEVKWHMCVPDSFKGRDTFQCSDVLKIFVTRRPSSFAPLLLPSLSTFITSDPPISRGTYSLLTRFLSGLSVGNRGGPDISDENWSTQSFIIHTTANSVPTLGS